MVVTSGKAVAETGLARRVPLAEREEIIESALTVAFVTVGEQLKAINDEWADYYKAKTGYETFEAYCISRWQMQRAHAYRLISAAEVYNDLSPVGDILPGNERVIRPLTRLPAKRQRQIGWDRSVKRAPKDAFEKPCITEKHVTAIVREMLHDTGDPDAFPGTNYRVVYADPPWKYNDDLVKGYGPASNHYPQMTILELCELKDGQGRG